VANQGISMKQLTNMINGMIGQKVLTEQQLQQIMLGAQKANQEGGMSAVLDYLLKVTQADVDKRELKRFADQVKANPQLGMDILKGRQKPNLKRRR